MLHEIIRNDRVAQSCNIGLNDCNIVPTLQRKVAVKIVVANLPV